MYRLGGVAVGGGVYGPGTGPVLASNVSCFGYEYSVSECANDTVLNPICTNQQDAGVMCDPGSGNY